ncbi:MAG: isoamylase early set domain-containing protein [Ekhidna sp.]|nr:isoamylase early set domain-containing protein [Ekhidna sp.]MBC6409915.1 isoamylase early set domain-containing protein [Ekhidna sp.]MBC6426801.1 isoamylase early set domain-containing protein [Ekhidna sp.]
MIKKQILKSKPVCKVTFGLSKKEVDGASKVNLVGEFNGWNESETELTKMKSGDFKIVLPLETGKAYQFRYLIDGNRWLNDPEADSYTPGKLGNELNGVIKL